MGINRGGSMPGLRQVAAHPVLETLSFRGVAPSEEVLELARRLAEELRPMIDPDVGCQLTLAQVHWLWRGEPTVEARVHTTCLGAPVTVYEEGATATGAVRAAFASLERNLRNLIEDERPERWPSAGPLRAVGALT